MAGITSSLAPSRHAVSEQEIRPTVEMLRLIIRFTRGQFWPNLNHATRRGTVMNPYADTTSESDVGTSNLSVRPHWGAGNDPETDRLSVSRAMSAACGDMETVGSQPLNLSSDGRRAQVRMKKRITRMFLLVDRRWLGSTGL